MTAMAQHTIFYVGTYTRTTSEGIYVSRMDNAAGAVEQLSVIGGIDNPAFVALDPRGERLYAVSEIDEFEGEASGAVYAYAISPGSGALTFLNRQPTGGPGPCHLTVDATGRYVVVANYQGGSVCMLPVGPDGSLEPMSDFVQHEGSSVNERRQDGPHAHSVNVDANNRFLFAPDLGMDKVIVYRPDLASGKLVPNDVPFVRAEPGAGPRHFAFHPSGGHAYVINELASTITAYRHDAGAGTLLELRTVSTLPEGYSGRSFTADLHIHPNGRFLYGSNRGHDSIAIFEIDGELGALTRVGIEPTHGVNPRNFAISPNGKFLLAENQDSDSIVTFQIDPATGELSPTGDIANIPMPVCIAFAT